jgi:hypothetical protein
LRWSQRARLTETRQFHAEWQRTIATGGTEADHVFTYMLDNHPGVVSTILNCVASPQ